TIKSEHQEQADEFLEVMVASFVAMEKNQKTTSSPSIADRMGLDNAVGANHLIEGAKRALEAWTFSIPGVTHSLEKTQFLETLETPWSESSIAALVWGYRGYAVFLDRNYPNIESELLAQAIDRFNQEYYRLTVNKEIRASYYETFQSKLAESPELVTDLDFETMVSWSLEALEHFEQRALELKNPIDFVGEVASYRIYQYRKYSHFPPTDGMNAYKTVTAEMDLSDQQQAAVALRVEEFLTGITAGIHLGIMQIKIGDD
ncbi:MAG: hypothetical protein AAF202_09450, partial [Pseudomonadota bacterium]